MTNVENIEMELGVDNLTAEFADLVMFYGDRLDAEKVILLPEDVVIIAAYREDCRTRHDWKTADYLRDVLIRSGLDVKDKK